MATHCTSSPMLVMEGAVLFPSEASLWPYEPPPGSRRSPGAITHECALDGSAFHQTHLSGPKRLLSAPVLVSPRRAPRSHACHEGRLST